jgi:hypothetical protein
MKPLFILIALSFAAHAWAQSEQLPEDIEREITEGKIAATEALAEKISLDEKQAHAIQLIKMVGIIANDHQFKEADRKNAQDAYDGFIARFHGIREDREALEKKEIMPDNKALANCSRRLDRLMADIQKFFK